MRTPRKISLFRIMLLLLAGFGAFAGGRLSLAHMQNGEVCPVIGILPACYMVFLGYLLIVVATIISKSARAKMLFYIGWAPVFLLALTGVTLELTQGHVCPPGALNIPQCFYSLTMAILCFVLWQGVIWGKRTP